LVGFCWPWIDFLEELGFEVLLANRLKVKMRAEDIKNDKVDSKTLAELLRMNWLPTCYVPPADTRWLRNLLRHSAYRTRLSTRALLRTGVSLSLGSALEDRQAGGMKIGNLLI
jgi:transposase